jgi:hypothetical protein
VILLLWILNMFAILAAAAGVVDDLLVPARFEAAEGVAWDDLVAETGIGSEAELTALTKELGVVPLGKGRYRVRLAELRAHQTLAKRVLDSPTTNVIGLLATAACAGMSLVSATAHGWLPWILCALAWGVQVPGYTLGFVVMWRQRARLAAVEEEMAPRTGTGRL